ncbi:hypothetical protein FB451DRAFT_1257118 [Mycena latifolia]|nr:hypothetical protein FB451DRAFT_1257118 [Mycena latifolia]
MHPGWQIPEIIQSIFEKLSEYPNGALLPSDPGLPPPQPGRPYESLTLSRLARTCSAFRDPALAILWREQDSILPLLQCFPPHLWEIEAGARRSRALQTFRFRATMSQMDWDRVLFYAARIEKLAPGWNLTSEVLEPLNVSLPTTCLFPNLQNLSWLADDECFPFIRLFLGPKITAIQLFPPSSAPRLSFLPYLASKFPSLTEIDIRDFGGSTTQETHEVISAFVLALNRLQRLSVEHISPAAYLHLARLPALRHLTIGNLRELAFPGIAASTSQTFFPSLRFISISTPIIDFGTNFLIQFSEAPLQRVDLLLENEELPRAIQLRKFLELLRDNCAHSSLTSINVRIGPNRSDPINIFGDPAPYKISVAVLRPLLGFTHLQRVTVLSPAGFSMHDNDIAELSRAWPHIEYLDLSMGMASSRTPSNVTIRALTHFARHCPRLNDLTLSLNPTGLVESDADLAPHEPRARQTALESLCVLFSPIDSPALIARFLSAMFPSLRRITTKHGNWWNDADEDLEDPEVVLLLKKWQEAEDLMPLLSGVRADEERYWTSKAGRAPATSGA